MNSAVEMARSFAVSCANAKASKEQIAIIGEALADFTDDPKVFRERIAAHFGLDMFDELYWKEPFEFRELS